MYLFVKKEHTSLKNIQIFKHLKPCEQFHYDNIKYKVRFHIRLILVATLNPFKEFVYLRFSRNSGGELLIRFCHMMMMKHEVSQYESDT